MLRKFTVPPSALVAALGYSLVVGCTGPEQAAGPEPAPIDTSGMQGSAEIGADGAIIRRVVQSSSGAQATLDPEVSSTRHALVVDDAAVVGDTVESGLKAAAAAAQPSDMIDVVVSVTRPSRAPRLPPLDNRQLRSSAVNVAAVARRKARFDEFAQERRGSQLAVARAIEAAGGKVISRHAVGNAIVAQIPAHALAPLGTAAGVERIEPRFDRSPAPADTNSNNDIVDARSKIASDQYYLTPPNSDGWFDWVGLIDTGVRASHTLFAGGTDHIDFEADCVKGGDSCFDSSQPGWNPGDAADHGTGSASIITGNSNLGSAWRGVSAHRVDSWKVGLDAFGGGTDVNAVLRAFSQGATNGDGVIAAVVQVKQNHDGVVSRAADDVYDLGVAVFGANGNFGASDAARAPANARRALGVGAYDVNDDALFGYSRGTSDGRFKPDLLMPTSTEVASSASDTAQKVFGGTSGATPYAAAVTVMLRNFYYDNLTNEVLPSPGLLFASLIAFGNEAPNSTTGSGKTKMGKKALSCSKWDWGSEFVAEGSSKVFNLTVGSGEKDLKAGIWWPDYGSHNDFNLTIVKGTTPIGSSTNTTSVFERVQKLGSLATGTYTVTIQAVRTQGTTAREVFWLVHRTKC